MQPDSGARVPSRRACQAVRAGMGGGRHGGDACHTCSGTDHLLTLLGTSYRPHFGAVLTSTVSPDGDRFLYGPRCQYSKIIQNPSHVELQKAANQGRRCTWEKLSAIKANCAIELALDECVAVLNHMRRLKRSAERAAAASHGIASAARFSASKRIPSWNRIARENSSGSLEDYAVADYAASHQGGVAHAHAGGTSSCTVRPQHGVHDGSDSESDSGDLCSWTRSGGPLMRTSSANKFITFVQSLEEREDAAESHAAVQHSVSFTIQGVAAGGEPHHNGDPRVTTPDGGDSENNAGESNCRRDAATAPISIVVSEGDLLQPERIPNGFVFSVIRKEVLTLADRGNESCSDSSDPCSAGPVTAECVQIENFGPGATSDTDEDEHGEAAAGPGGKEYPPAGSGSSG